MRKDVLQQLHESHQGASWTKQRVHLTVYWPGIDNDIEIMVSRCVQCQTHLLSHAKESIVSKPRPSRPFAEIARLLLLWWPVLCGCSGLLHRLVRTVVLDLLWSDRGPQFTSKKFQDFAVQWGFKHQVSSPHYPHSNGKAEAMVKSMKKIIHTAWNGRYLDGDKLCTALLQYRNTPSSRDGLSPAQKLFGCPVQDTLPAHPKSFDPQWQTNLDRATEKAEHIQRAAECYYNRQAHSLPEIHVGSQVVLQDPRTRLWHTYGVVIRMG